MTCDHPQAGQCYAEDNYVDNTLTITRADPHIRISYDIVRDALTSPTERLSCHTGTLYIGHPRKIRYALSDYCRECKTCAGELRPEDAL